MRVTVDTNVLVRSVVSDDPRQTATANRLLRESSSIAVPVQCLCEFVWVLRKAYGIAPAAIARTIRALMETESVIMSRPLVEAGLSLLEEGGDFADGVIAHEGRWMGGDAFVSFDERAVAMLKARGHSARLLS